MISLDYDDTLQAAAGFQVEEIRKRIMKDYKGRVHSGRRRQRAHRDGGVYCTVGGDTFLEYSAGNRRGRQGHGGLGVLRFQRLRAGGQAESDRRQAGARSSSRTKPSSTFRAARRSPK